MSFLHERGVLDSVASLSDDELTFEKTIQFLEWTDGEIDFGDTMSTFPSQMSTNESVGVLRMRLEASSLLSVSSQ